MQKIDPLIAMGVAQEGEPSFAGLIADPGFFRDWLTDLGNDDFEIGNDTLNDFIYNALRVIADGHPTPGTLARAVLTVAEADFPRYRAANPNPEEPVSDSTVYVVTTGGDPGDDDYRVVSIHPERPTPASVESGATVRKVDLDILAWDISDAFAKTEDAGLDFGMDEIKSALPDFIAALIANTNDQPSG